MLEVAFTLYIQKTRIHCFSCMNLKTVARLPHLSLSTTIPAISPQNKPVHGEFLSAPTCGLLRES
jgi:hypothetical protein